jgi:CubicO group peptidase (beta-lactamase class C family)
MRPYTILTMTQFSHEIHDNMTDAQSMYAGADDAKRPVKTNISHKGAEGPPDLFDQLETLIKEQLPRSSVADVLVHLGTPMVSIGVLDSGNITTKVLGSPKPNNNKTTRRTPPLFNTDTIFQACSISKAMTAIAVFKFCQEGKLDLDTPIYRYLTSEQLSWICTPKTYQLASQITLGQLLSHTAGLSVHGFRGYQADELPSLYQLLTGLPPANNAPITVDFIPGQKYSYSGGGYSVIQLILERLQRKSHYKIMEEILLKPLNMDRSTYKVLSLDGENYASAYLTGKIQADPDHHTQPEAAAAGLWTTPGDMLKAVRAIQESLETGGFLEREWAEKMLTEVEDNGVGLGWKGKKDDTYFFHPGDNMPGYTAWCGGYMDRGSKRESRNPSKEKGKQKEGTQSESEKQQIPTNCGMSIMVNSALGERVIGKILSAIAYLKGWPDVSTTYMEVPLVDGHKSIDDRALNWCGNWGPGKWTLVDDNGLFVKFGSSAKMPLVSAAIPPITYDEGQSIDLVVDGLEILLRLGWKDGSRIIKLRQDRETKTLERQD